MEKLFVGALASTEPVDSGASKQVTAQGKCFLALKPWRKAKTKTSGII